MYNVVYGGKGVCVYVRLWIKIKIKNLEKFWEAKTLSLSPVNLPSTTLCVYPLHRKAIFFFMSNVWQLDVFRITVLLMW
jgi:hypothetical protein